MSVKQVEFICPTFQSFLQPSVQTLWPVKRHRTNTALREWQDWETQPHSGAIKASQMEAGEEPLFGSAPALRIRNLLLSAYENIRWVVMERCNQISSMFTMVMFPMLSPPPYSREEKQELYSRVMSQTRRKESLVTNARPSEMVFTFRN